MSAPQPVDALASSVPRFAWRRARGRWLAVVLYALAMAYVESAAVLYLRTIYGGIDPVAPRKPPFDPLPDFVLIEIGREAATMVMLLSVGWLAGRGLAGRFGAFAVAMGVWDIFYYVFLWLFAGWPGSLVAPDVLFLIPLPWWGPVLAPMLAAAVMVVAGSVAIARELGDGVPRMTSDAWLPLAIGNMLCLYAFMADTLQAFSRAGSVAAYNAPAGEFSWPIFLAGVALCVFGLGKWLIRSHGSVRRPYLWPRLGTRRAG